MQRDRWGGEGLEEWHARRIGSGMRGMRLPGHYTVTDAELAGVLMVLDEMARAEDAAARRCLIMSDCEAAMRMIERAWRARRRREYARGARGAMLEAICTCREQLEMVVFM